MKGGESKFRPACRSLLQKAVRRGSVHLVQAVALCLKEIGDFSWLVKRTAVITFEENWTLGGELRTVSELEDVVSALVRVARAVKNKDATGLGSLALAFSTGDCSVLSGDSDDHAIAVVAEAIRRPNDFWEWVVKECDHENQRSLVEAAHKFYLKGGWLWDRAFMQAAAYLAVTQGVPASHLALHCDEDFPLWIALDKHTPQGKQAIYETSQQVKTSPHQLAWVNFYCESAITNDSTDSRWWSKEVHWRLSQVNLDYAQAQSLWDKARPILIRRLEAETEALKQYISLSKRPGIQQLEVFHEPAFSEKDSPANGADKEDNTGQQENNSASLDVIQLELFE